MMWSYLNLLKETVTFVFDGDYDGGDDENEDYDDDVGCGDVDSLDYCMSMS